MSHTKLLAALAENVVYIRVIGRATFASSPSFCRFCDELINEGIEKLVVDLQECATMDSTFMGVLTKFGLEQLEKGAPVELQNIGSNNKRLLAELGVDELFAFVGESPLEAEWVEIFESGSAGNEALLEQGKVSLLAHQKLIEADGRNAARFGAVVDSLADDVRSLEDLDQSQPDDGQEHVY